MISQKRTLSWEALSLTHKPTGKTILHNLKGEVNSGQFLTIMGQSGAGKSSFLSIITARITKKTKDFVLEGSAMINSECYEVDEFSKIAAYVRQDDILLGTLTVYETFKFQAELKLNSFSQVEMEFQINKIIRQLNLEECRNGLVGSQMSKGISGGQRKRVAIGVQLLSDPQIMILDEPTSGLDSHNALLILRILKNLATEQNKIIMATLHQPSSQMFHEMDRMLILSLGSTLYLGPANHIVDYMENIGVKVNHRMNPADFLMLQISEYQKSKGHITAMTPQRFEQYSLTNSKLLQSSTRNPLQEPKQLTDSIYARMSYQQAPYLVQLRVLMLRSWRNFYRIPSNIIGKAMGFLIVPLVMTIIYYNLGNDFPKQDDPQYLQKLLSFLQSFSAFCFIFSFSAFGMNIYDTVLSFPREKQLVLKESSSSLYSLFVYYWCRCLVELPICLVTASFTALLMYWMTSLDPKIEFIAKFVLIVCMIALTGYMMGTTVGILFSSAEHAIQLLPLILLPLLIFGGLVINLRTIPKYASWFQYLSPLRHSYSCMIMDQLSTPKFDNIINSAFKQQIEELVGINGSFWPNLSYLGIQLVTLVVISLVGLTLKKKAL